MPARGAVVLRKTKLEQPRPQRHQAVCHSTLALRCTSAASAGAGSRQRRRLCRSGRSRPPRRRSRPAMPKTQTLQRRAARCASCLCRGSRVLRRTGAQGALEGPRLLCSNQWSVPALRDGRQRPRRATFESTAAAPAATTTVRPHPLSGSPLLPHQDRQPFPQPGATHADGRGAAHHRAAGACGRVPPAAWPQLSQPHPAPANPLGPSCPPLALCRWPCSARCLPSMSGGSASARWQSCRWVLPAAVACCGGALHASGSRGSALQGRSPATMVTAGPAGGVPRCAVRGGGGSTGPV